MSHSAMNNPLMSFMKIAFNIPKHSFSRQLSTSYPFLLMTSSMIKKSKEFLNKDSVTNLTKINVMILKLCH